MKFEKIVKERRSIREYTKKVPAEADIEKIINAGIWAPSGLNNQPWKFKIIKDKDIKENLSALTKYKEIIKNAPILICVFLDNTATYNRDKDLMAVGACIQNMLLEAYELGLGTCWLGEIINRKLEVNSLLKIDNDFELMAVIALGYSDEGLTKGCRKGLKSFLIE